MPSDTPSAGAGRTSAALPILVITDDLLLRERLYDLLQRFGRAVITSHSGERALAILKHERPAIIVADGRLPDTTGPELVHEVQRCDASLPVILLDDDHPDAADDAPVSVYTVLPATVDDQTLVDTIAVSLQQPAVPQHSPRCGAILIVDDEPKLRTVLQEVLGSYGFTVLTAGSGEEALDQIKRAPPHVVLLDIKMPGMDGLVTLKKIKREFPSLIVIMMTGLGDEDLIAQAFALGAYDYIIKPLNLKHLESVLLNAALYR